MSIYIQHTIASDRKGVMITEGKKKGKTDRQTDRQKMGGND